MKKHASKVVLSAFLSILLLSSTLEVAAYSKDVVTHDAMINLLVQKGYANETAEALEETELKEIYTAIKDGKNVEISTCAMEVDELGNIEDTLMNEKTLISDDSNDENNTKEVKELLELSDKELKKQYGMTDSEIKATRVIEELATSDNDYYCKKDDDVIAAGTISSSKLKYTQTVTDQSTKKKCQYKVNLSYAWPKPYKIGAFSDKIVVAWGGGMSSKSEKGTSSYCFVGKNSNVWNTKSYYKKNPVSMSKEFYPNKGCRFSFKQTVSANYAGGYKAKSGSASLTVFQSGKPSKWTKIISYYCHQTLKFGTGIGVSASGPSVSISIGKAYDKTPQKSKDVKFSK